MDKLRRFMYGRYGVDELCYALVILGMVFTFTATPILIPSGQFDR